MAEFVCRYGTPGGDIQQRVYVADSENALRRQMEDQGFYVFGIKRNFEVKSVLKALTLKKKIISDRKFMVFNQELASLIKSGLPILQSLELLKQRPDNPEFSEVMESIYQQVKSGTALSEAFGSYPEIFPRVYTASIYAGEKSATLEQVIRRYIGYMKILLAIRTKVTSSLIYPLLLLGLSFAVIAILIGYVIPKFAEFYEGFGGELPWITTALLTVAHFVRGNYILLILGTITAAIFFRIYLRTSATARSTMDRIKLKLPFIGGIYTKFSNSQLTRTLHTLLAGGIPLVNSIEIAAGSIGNRVIAGHMASVTQGVKEGAPLWKSLDQTKMMPHMAIEMIRVGEETGSIEEMLKNISDFYDEEIDTKLTNMLAIIEPVMLIVMGVLIAVILFAMYYPLLSAISTVR